MPKQREYVESVHDSGAHLLTVINDILDLAKIEAGKFELRWMEPVEPTELAQGCADLLREHARARNVEIAVDLQPTLPIIEVDIARIRQILLNLLDNAFKFSPAGAEVRLTVRERDEDMIEFVVEDSGPGMSAAEAQIALQPFG